MFILIDYLFMIFAMILRVCYNKIYIVAPLRECLIRSDIVMEADSTITIDSTIESPDRPQQSGVLKVYGDYIDFSPSAQEKSTSAIRQEMFLDNLLNRVEEEDIVLFGSLDLLALAERAKQEPASLDWEAELDEL